MRLPLIYHPLGRELEPFLHDPLECALSALEFSEDVVFVKIVVDSGIKDSD